MATSLAQRDRRHHVVVIGGGFAGLNVVQHLNRPEVRVTLIDKRNFHLFQPLLYQIATATLSPANISAPLRHVLRRQRNADVILGQAVDIDPAARTVELADRTLVPYDSLVVAAGTVNNYFGREKEWSRVAPGLKSIEEAIAIRQRMLLAFERADREYDPVVREAWLTFVIVGGGPTGVEMAGAIAEIARDVLRREYRHIDTTRTRVVLVEGLPRVLPTYSEEASRHARAQLERLGVEVITGHLLSEAHADHVVVGRGDDARRIDCRTAVWSAGVKGHPLGQVVAQRFGASLDRMQRVVVDSTCAVPDYPNVFVIGDLARFHDPHWHPEQPLPGVAQVAIQQGAYVGKLIRRRVREERRGRRIEPEPFRYHDHGSMAVIGRGRAVADLGSVHVYGFAAWVAWLFIHVLWLVGFANRLLVLVQWGVSYLTLNRNVRLITGEPDLTLTPIRSRLDKLAPGDRRANPDAIGWPAFEHEGLPAPSLADADADAVATAEASATDKGKVPHGLAPFPATQPGRRAVAVPSQREREVAPTSGPGRETRPEREPLAHNREPAGKREHEHEREPTGKLEATSQSGEHVR